jgi:hypothetical protein
MRNKLFYLHRLQRTQSYRRSFGSLDHCRVTRNSLRQATEHGIDENRLIIPTDGQLVTVLKVPISTAQVEGLCV